MTLKRRLWLIFLFFSEVLQMDWRELLFYQRRLGLLRHWWREVMISFHPLRAFFFVWKEKIKCERSCSLSLFCCSGHFGLWVDESLYLGRSSPCFTFNNCCLSDNDDFRVLELEVWTFGWGSFSTRLTPLPQPHWSASSCQHLALTILWWPLHRLKKEKKICFLYDEVDFGELKWMKGPILDSRGINSGLFRSGLILLGQLDWAGVIGVELL